MVTVPLVGLSLILNEMVSPSYSSASKVISTALSSSVIALTFMVLGSSSTAVTVTVTRPAVLDSPPSLAI
jgi:hypothetical protein